MIWFSIQMRTALEATSTISGFQDKGEWVVSSESRQILNFGRSRHCACGQLCNFKIVPEIDFTSSVYLTF